MSEGAAGPRIKNPKELDREVARKVITFLRERLETDRLDVFDFSFGRTHAHRTMATKLMSVTLRWSKPIVAPGGESLPQGTNTGYKVFIRDSTKPVSINSKLFQPTTLNIPHAAIVSMIGNKVSNQYPAPIVFGSRVLGEEVENEMDRQRNAVQKAMGGVAGSCFTVLPNTLEADCEAAFIPPSHNLFMSREFVRTMANVGRHNLMNGIIYIPRIDAIKCGLNVSAPEVLDLPDSIENKRLGATITWLFIPKNHVLAWAIDGMPPEHYDKIGFRVFALRVPAQSADGDPTVPGYLISNDSFDRLVAQFMDMWGSKEAAITYTDFNQLFVEATPQFNTGNLARQLSPGEVIDGYVEMNIKIEYLVQADPNMTLKEASELYPAVSKDLDNRRKRHL